MSESNGELKERGEPLLHTGRLGAQFYAGRVFNLSGSEIIFLLLAGLVILGPERLPGVIRSVGRVYGEVRRMAQGIENEIKDTFAEPVSDLRKTAQDIRTGFGEVDTEPSPPMRPERSATPQELAAMDIELSTDSPSSTDAKPSEDPT